MAGAVFLAVYGWRALRRACQPQQDQVAEGGAALRQSAALPQAAAFSLLNPHAYVDTVLLVGVALAGVTTGYLAAAAWA